MRWASASLPWALAACRRGDGGMGRSSVPSRRRGCRRRGEVRAHLGPDGLLRAASLLRLVRTYASRWPAWCWMVVWLTGLLRFTPSKIIQIHPAAASSTVMCFGVQ